MHRLLTQRRTNGAPKETLMRKNIFILGILALGIAACSTGDGTGATSQAVKLDVRCATDDQCPAGFQCEQETEHDVTTSYCISDDDQGTATGACPAGFELEVEHEGTFCKPDDDASGGTTPDDDASGGTTPEGGACATSADCASGLECETEIENGVTSSTCRPHGGKG
jgi:hypothetical protein